MINNNKENPTKSPKMDFLEVLYWAIEGIDSATAKYRNLAARHVQANEQGEAVRNACLVRVAILARKKKLLVAYIDLLKGGISLDQSKT